MDEKAFLDRWQKSLGVEIDFTEIEERHARKRREAAMLESINNELLKLSVPQLNQVKEVFADPVAIFEEPVITEELIDPQPLIEMGRQLEPELPKDNIINKTVKKLSLTPQKDIQQVADSLPPGIQKELNIIKKSLADFHRFAQRHSQMGGGGEVNLRYLDDIDRSTIYQGHFLTYDNSTKKFVFAQIAEGNVDLSHIDQNLTPGSNGVYNLGSPTDYWSNAYLDSIFLDGGGIQANGSFGSNNQVLTSNGASAYWHTPTYLISENNTYKANLDNSGVLSVPGNIIPNANQTYSLGNTTNRWESLWVGSNSVTFTDQNASFPDQTLTVANGVFYITDSLDNKLQSNAGFQVGNFLLQNNYISLTNATSEFYIGTTIATGNLVINRPIVVYATNTISNPTFTVSRNGEVQLFTANIQANKQSLSIVGSSDGSTQSIGLAGRMIHVTGNDGTPSRIENDAFGTGAFAAYIGRSGRGTANTPSATQNTDVIARFAALGWGATNFLATNIGSGPPINSIDFVASENYTDTNAGSKINFYTSPIGARTRTLSLTVDANTVNVPKYLIVNNTIYANSINTNTLIATVNVSTETIYANNITSYSNISGNSATFTSNVNLNGNTTANALTVNGNATFNANVVTNANLVVNTATVTGNLYIGNVGVATKLVVSGGANDQILVSNGTTLNWTARHTDGSWTPVMVPAAGSNVVFTVNNAKYVKVGPVVTAHFDIVVSSKGTASGDLKLDGLPFTSLVGTAGNYEGTISMGYFANLNVTDAIHFSGAVIQDSNTADLWLSTLNGQHIAQAPLNTTDVKIGSRFVGTVIYSTDF